jgi:hypothetical protein
VIPWNYLVTLIAPDFFGNPVTRNDWFGHYAEWAGFAGVVPIIFALVALIHWRQNWRVIFFGGLGLFGLLMAYDTLLVDAVIVLKIPVLSTSAASRIIVLVSFSIAVLGAYGLDIVTKIWHTKQPESWLNKLLGSVFRRSSTPAVSPSGWWYAVIGIGVVLSIIWVSVLSGSVLFLSDVTSDQIAIGRRNAILPTLLTIGAIGIVSGYIRLLRHKDPKGIIAHVVLVLVLIVSSYDMLRFATKWMPEGDPELVFPPMEMIKYVDAAAGDNRVLTNAPYALHNFVGIQGLEGYDPLYISRYGEFMRAVGEGTLLSPERSVVGFPKHGLHTQQVLNVMGVRYIAHAKADGREVWAFPFWEHDAYEESAIYSDEYYEVYKNNHAYPRAFITYDYVVETDEQQIIDTMFSEDMDLRKTVVLEQEPEHTITSCDAYEPTAGFLGYTPNNVQISVSSGCRGILFVSDVFYDGWTASVNDDPAQILRANYTFRAVEIPAGDSTVEFSLDRIDR